MGLLARSVLLTCATACYSPDLRDCSLTCASAADCAGDQVCTSEHFCAAADHGSCASGPGLDAGARDAAASTEPRDAAITVAPDAALDAAIDAPTLGSLAITIEGKGWVNVVGAGTCDSDSPQDGSCTFAVPLAVATTVYAAASEDWRFDRWTTSTCPEEDSATCVFVPQLVTAVGVKFRKDN